VRTFGSPRWTNNKGKYYYESMFPDTIRYHNWGDFVPDLPPRWNGYAHAGKEKRIGNLFPFEGLINLLLHKYNHDLSTLASHDNKEYTAILESMGL
jgi:hypothetical protein